jgi:lambda repressor-like predicted transcriptional regulator
MAEKTISITTIRCDTYKCVRWLRIIDAVLVPDKRIELNGNLSEQDVKDMNKIAKHLKMEAKVIGRELHVEEAADWEAELKKNWTQEDLLKIFEILDLKDHEAWVRRYIDPLYQYNSSYQVTVAYNIIVQTINGYPLYWNDVFIRRVCKPKLSIQPKMIPNPQMAEKTSITVIRCDTSKCIRWLRVVGTILRLNERIEPNGKLSRQDVKDMNKIAKHLRMRMVIGRELYLKESIHIDAAADWEKELKKNWIQEDLLKIYETLGIKDHEAWVRRYINPTYQYSSSHQAEPVHVEAADEILVNKINGHSSHYWDTFIKRFCHP